MNFFEQMWEQNKEGLAQQATNQLSNIGTQLIQNQVNSLFKINNNKQGSVVATTPQMAQVMSSNNNMYYYIAGGVGALIIIFLIVRR